MHETTARSERPTALEERSEPRTATPPARRARWPWIAAAVAALVVAVAVLRGGGEPAGPQRGGPGGPTPVRAAEVERGDVVLSGRYPGELVGEAVELAPKVGGRLVEVRVRPGERVERGRLVAVIDDRDLARQLDEERGRLELARAGAERAAALAAEADADLERGRRLFDDRLLSRQDLERLEARAATARADRAAAAAEIGQADARVGRLGQQLADTRLEAPFTAVVAERHLDPGAFVQAGTPVVRLVEAGTLLVQFRVPERHLGSVAPGDPLAVTTQATGGTRFDGRVLRIAGEVSRADRTALVEGTIAEPSAVLRPGMYAEVEVQLEALRDRLTVPGPAVVERVTAAGEAETGVFTVDEGGAARWRPVEVVGREGDRVAVQAQLEPGQRVLTLGHEELSDGSPVKVVATPGAAGAAGAGGGAAAATDQAAAGGAARSER